MTHVDTHDFLPKSPLRILNHVDRTEYYFIGVAEVFFQNNYGL